MTELVDPASGPSTAGRDAESGAGVEVAETAADADPERDGDRSPDPGADRNSDPSADRNSDPSADPEAVADRLRERGERVRRRELDTALDRLEATGEGGDETEDDGDDTGEGELTAAQRRVLARLSARLTDALVEQWARRLDDGVDAERALALLTE